MAVINARDAELHVSTTSGGTYAPIGKVLTFSKRSEQADDETIYVLAESQPILEAGDDESTLDLTFLYDPADTTGQQVLRTARANGTSVFIRALWDGTAGEQQEMQVVSLNMDVDPNGTGVNKYVRGSMTLRSAGPVSTVTGTP